MCRFDCKSSFVTKLPDWLSALPQYNSEKEAKLINKTWKKFELGNYKIN